MMQATRNTIVSLCAAALLAGPLAGCANIQDDSTRTKTEGTLVGAGAGAALGAGIGAIAGGGRGTAIGAIIGALVGTAVGFGVGTHVANEKSKYASEEDWLDECIARADQTNQEAAQYNAEIRAQIQALDKKTTALAASYKQKKADRKVMLAEAEALKRKRNELAANIKAMQREIAEQREAVADAKPGKRATRLEGEIASMEKKLKEMRGNDTKLVAISKRVKV
jgi:gas vesicle protein